MTNIRQYKFRPFELKKEKYSNDLVPGPRSGHRICCDDKNLYSFGGYNYRESEVQHNLYKEIFKYNFVRKSWTLLNEDEDIEDDCPEELASSAMAMHGKTLMIFGGTSYPFGIQCSNKVYLCNTDEPMKISKFITANEPFENPPPQYGMSIAYNQNHLYTVGGTEGYHYSADIHRLNFTTRKWETMALSRPEINTTDPTGRYRHEIAITDKLIYIFGGGTADRVFELKDIPAFDIENRQWLSLTTIPDPKEEYPKPRKCHSLVQQTYKNDDDVEETDVYIIGGNNLEAPLSDLWKLSLRTLQWTKYRQAFKHTIYFHDSCITSDGCLYTFGGITTNGQRTNSLYKIWVKIPKLSAIAWESLLHYYPNIARAPKNYMLEKGVPLKYADRVHL